MDIRFTNNKTGKTYQMRRKENNGHVNPRRVAKDSYIDSLMT